MQPLYSFRISHFTWAENHQRERIQQDSKKLQNLATQFLLAPWKQRTRSTNRLKWSHEKRLASTWCKIPRLSVCFPMRWRDALRPQSSMSVASSSEFPFLCLNLANLRHLSLMCVSRHAGSLAQRLSSGQWGRRQIRDDVYFTRFRSENEKLNKDLL